MGLSETPSPSPRSISPPRPGAASLHKPDSLPWKKPVPMVAYVLGASALVLVLLSLQVREQPGHRQPSNRAKLASLLSGGGGSAGADYESAPHLSLRRVMDGGGSGSGDASTSSRPWMLRAPIVAQTVRDDPAVRQQYWWDCLDAGIDAACRPNTDAEKTVLSFSEWKRHTAEVLEATRRFRGLPPFSYFNPKYNTSRYDGPWVEDHFISAFLDAGKMELFYPLVPLFVQWTDVLLGGNQEGRGEELRRALLDPAHSPLRGDVLYATVMQMDRIPDAVRPPCAALRNVLVFGAAGWGNVPIPLIKGFYKPHNHHYWPPETDPVTYHARRFVTGFIGEEKRHGHGAFRTALAASSLPPESTMIFAHDMWTWMVHAAVFIASQRGYDRAAYRTYETLQYGRIVLMLYDDGDVPWTPYQHVADFASPAEAAAMQQSGQHDPSAYGAVLGSGGAPTDGTGEPASNPALWGSVLNEGGMWGPGGVGFALSYSQVDAFFCVACDFVAPGSAARWRSVRTLPLHLYGKGEGLLCPCTTEAWRATAASLPVPSTLANMTLTPSSLVYEMERRVLGVSNDYFTYAAVMKHIEAYMLSPVGAALKCVPRPAAPRPGGGKEKKVEGEA